MTAAEPGAAWLLAARRAPVCALEALTAGGPILVLAPHPDDESLGCGGLIAACRAAGIAVAVALLTDGSGSHPGSATHPPTTLAALRLAEMQAALAALGLPPEALHSLGWPDRQAPMAGEPFARAAAQLTALMRALNVRTLFGPWRHDPHGDHVAGAAIAAAAALATGARLLCYPVWGLLPSEDGASDGPPAGRVLRFDAAPYLAAKRAAIACHRSQLGGVITDAAEGFTLPQALIDRCLEGSELFFEEAEASGSSAVPAGFFDALYARNPDPWLFESSAYEQAKYEATLAALGRARFGRGLEIGCSIGVLTQRLAGRCDDLLAIDLAEPALARARARCAGMPGVRFARLRVPDAWPSGMFDLILLSEVLYFLQAPAIVACAERAIGAIEPGGVILLVNWLGRTDTALPGDEAAALFAACCRGRLAADPTIRTERYRIDRFVRD